MVKKKKIKKEKMSIDNEKIKCACGCGRILYKYDNKNRERKFIVGHNASTKDKNSKVKAKCLTCGKEFEFYPSKTKGKFCSKKCQYNYDYKGCYWLGKNGYMYYQKGRKYKVLVHRQVINAKKGQIVHHKDGNKLNNNINNLEILSSQSEHIKKHNPILARWHPQENWVEAEKRRKFKQ